MDKVTLKAFIIEFRDSGLTFREISEKLALEHKVYMSRQAVQGVYQRTLNSKDSKIASERIVATSDIVNLYCLGYNMTEVNALVTSLGSNVSYNDVINIIKSDTDYIQEVKESLINTVSGIIDEIERLDVLYDVLSYKGIKPTEKGLKDIVKDVYKTIIKDEVNTILASAYQISDDRAFTRSIMESLDLKFSISDIASKL